MRFLAWGCQSLQRREGGAIELLLHREVLPLSQYGRIGQGEDIDLAVVRQVQGMGQ